MCCCGRRWLRTSTQRRRPPPRCASWLPGTMRACGSRYSSDSLIVRLTLNESLLYHGNWTCGTRVVADAPLISKPKSLDPASFLHPAMSRPPCARHARGSNCIESVQPLRDLRASNPEVCAGNPTGALQLGLSFHLRAEQPLKSEFLAMRVFLSAQRGNTHSIVLVMLQCNTEKRASGVLVFLTK